MKTTRYTTTSKKVIAIALALVLFATIFKGCNRTNEEEITTTTTEVQTTIEVVTEIVTDEDGETVTDDNGEILTTEVTKVVEVTSKSDEDEQTSSKKASSTTSTTKGSSTSTTKQTETTTKKNSSSSSSNKVTTTTKPVTTTTTTKPAVTECNHTWTNWKNIRIWVQEKTCSKCGWIEEREVDNRDDYMGTKAEYLEFLGYLNEARREAGVSEVKYSDELQTGANTRAKELTVKFSHTRPNGSDSSTAFNTSNYIIAGENIGSGYTSAKNVFNGWMNSEGHRKAMLGNAGTHICVARCDNQWVLILAIDADEFDGVWE